jgi:hypothetical protein
MPSGENGRNFGSDVTGYLITEGRSFETAVFQRDKYVQDKELNLAQDLGQGFALELARLATPSGWLTNDSLNSSSFSIFTVDSAANRVVLANGLRAQVNGWPLLVSYSGSSLANQITLPACPAVGSRTDLVILEVWRRLLSTTGDGKSLSGRIWRNGNVKVASGDDASLNYADQILDSEVGVETTKRVQIQYRLRVVTDVDLFQYPSGLDDPSIIANTVPAAPGSPDGTASTFNFVSQSSLGDSGLWVAGDGIATNGLGAVDGYMYAIPLCAIFRRNLTAFSKNTNHNGGVATPGPSDRPDGLFSDVVVESDLADLRHSVSISGWNYSEVLEKNLSYLFSNQLKTEWATTSKGGGVTGHTLFCADEIGSLTGDGVDTGVTPGAEFIGEFDCTRRFFSDRSNYEILTLKLTPGDPNISTGSWSNGTVVTITPASLAQWPYPSTINFFDRAPSGARVIDVVRARIQGVIGAKRSVPVGFDALQSTSSVPYPITNIQGLGGYPLGNITVTLGNPPVVASDEDLYLDLLVAYPPGQGLTRTPVEDFGDDSFVINNPGTLSASAPISYVGMETQSFDYTHRETCLQYYTSQQTFNASTGLGGETKVYLPERVSSLVEVRVNSSVDSGAILFGTSGRVVQLSGATPAAGVVSVDYIALRPVPQTIDELVPGVQFTVFYKARAPQTIHSSLLGTELNLTPRWVSSTLYCLASGSGSQGEGSPYPYAYVQSGAALKATGLFGGEHELGSPPDLELGNLSIPSGMLGTPVQVPCPLGVVTLDRDSGDTDIEGRTYFTGVSVGVGPSAYGQPLNGPRTHKVILPMLVEATVEGTSKKGSLLLVNLVRWAEFDKDNKVVLVTSNSTTVASVFRVSGNLLNRKV